MASITRYSAVALLAVAIASCTTKKSEPPAPAGPSEFGTSLVLTASPDLLSQDGQSTSQITIQARDANGQPLRNLPLRVDISVGGTITDFGRLSQKNISTGSDGRATVTYTAPPQVDNIDRQTTVTIEATPLHGDARGNTRRTVDIRLVPTGVVGGETDVPDFTFTPGGQQLQTITFDASHAQLDAVLVHYEWDFGDGSTSTGRTVGHQFREAGSFMVTLTVTDLAGRKGSRSKNVSISSSGNPTASFIFSPSSPGIGEEIIFNGSGSSAIAPRTIVSYDWQFGTDRTGTGMIATKRYDTAGTYNVSLTVTDDAGNKGTSSSQVTVGTDSEGGLSPRFTFSPGQPVMGTAVAFNASTSTAPGTTITRYEWDFGDPAQAPRPLVTTQKIVNYTYGSAGSYTVTLRIRDSQGRTAATTQQVTVVTP